MIPGHTKFKCDGNFGIIKKLYRRTRISLFDHVVEVVKGGKGFQYLDIKAIWEFFQEITKHLEISTFLFEASNLRTVKVQEIANGSFAEFNLLKTKKADIFEEIEALSILVLKPPSLDYKRQEYLYNNICPFVRDEFKDITCPMPVYAIIE